MIYTLLRLLFPPRLTPLEEYLVSKKANTPEEVNFWIAEYEQEQRLRNRQVAMQ